MNETDKILQLERENVQLRKDNEMLLNIIEQMKVTLNRMINHYMIKNKDGETA